MKIKISRYCPTNAARFFSFCKVHRHSKSTLRFGIAGILFVAAAGFAAMAIKPPKLPWVAPLIPTGSWPVHIMVDQATNTAYIANQLDNTISVVDGRNCSARRTPRCTPIATISPGQIPLT
jgi:DNA-binding beta-propeller fold protein YncE